MATRPTVRTPCSGCKDDLRALGAVLEQTSADLAALREANENLLKQYLTLATEYDRVMGPHGSPQENFQEELPASRKPRAEASQLASVQHRPVRSTGDSVLRSDGRVLHGPGEVGPAVERGATGPVLRPSHSGPLTRGPMDPTAPRDRSHGGATVRLDSLDASVPKFRRASQRRSQ